MNITSFQPDKNSVINSRDMELAMLWQRLKGIDCLNYFDHHQKIRHMRIPAWIINGGGCWKGRRLEKVNLGGYSI